MDSTELIQKAKQALADFANKNPANKLSEDNFHVAVGHRSEITTNTRPGNNVKNGGGIGYSLPLSKVLLIRKLTRKTRKLGVYKLHS
jgi:hypothetical protein